MRATLSSASSRQSSSDHHSEPEDPIASGLAGRPRRRTLTTSLSLLAVVGIGLIPMLGTGCGQKTGNPNAKKIIVLGIDGLDPTILTRFMDQGELPAFRRLREQGNMRKLTTSIPPQSPVAWSNFITGMNPGGHGIFDFIHRDRENETPTPKFSASGQEEIGFSLSFGDYFLPLTGGAQINLRKGRAFWEILADHDIPASVYKIPVNYPPSSSLGVTYSGMGTPDVLGTQGTSYFFTDNPPSDAAEASGVKIVSVLVDDNQVSTSLEGPPDALLNTEAQLASPPLLAPLHAYLDPENKVAKIDVGDSTLILEEGEWSDWVGVQFEVLKMVGVDVLPPLSGVCRFYLKEISPDFKLYVSPVNLDPADEASAISEPADAAVALAEKMGGAFYTQNMPEDFQALGSGILDPDEFVQQSNLVVAERQAMFDHALENFQSGLIFFYVGSIDLNCHMFFRAFDEKHPAYLEEIGEEFGGRLLVLYKEADAFLQKTLDQMPSDATLILMSDHGFAPFYRQVQLANWLRDKGYLVVKEEPPSNDEEGQDGKTTYSVDWTKTRAYSMGVNGLYLNLKNREKCGIVEPGKEAEQLLEEISFELYKLRDEDPRFAEDGSPAQVIHHVYKGKECYQGEYTADGPDLVVGYNRGYRSADDAGLCTVTNEPILTDRNEWWSGDHCMSHTLVPGTLMSNKPLGKQDPALYDLPVSILEAYGIKVPENMVGSTIF